MDWKHSKRYHTPEDEEEGTSREEITLYKEPHNSQVGSPTGWKVTGSQRLICRSESSESHAKSPCLGIWFWEKEPPEHMALEASGACVQEQHGTWKMETHSWKAHTGSRAKQSLHRYLGWTWLQFLEDLLGKWGDSGLWGKGIGSKALGNIHHYVILWR